MEVYEKLSSIKNACDFTCSTCRYAYMNNRDRRICSLRSDYIYPHNWDDEFIRNLASALERPKVKRLKQIDMYEVWQCPLCRTLYRYDEPDWKYCPICGAELEG